MALEHAILVSLAERSGTGYELARRFDASIGNFWKASHQQIYKVLGRMEADALVTSQTVTQDGRPDKKVYALTDAGRSELARFTTEPSAPEPLRSSFAVKLRALEHGDREAILADVRRKRAHHAERLAYYETSAERFYPDPDSLDPADVGPWLVLRGGIIGEQTALSWCDEILERLEGRAPR
ncbi:MULTISPECIES: PadR family transcriptional regulator [unclassified Aeromicrobium]|jgi:DNA-binding PadR family transcriptional regulator|uniref:PadR family transcriptional regulator n=1 Tax=unclassified Aeromicrobium TaxID=2633570 RepID=UPI002098046C|nr:MULTISPECIES: PadR family transcriptional regulator [unclassified Aeromicrobium]MCO7239353.1 PadR family transcriptional regulator [Aeromicrobium sp. CnD17-E]MDR6117767.1 DNA-binding PadR family transcriptional regulator [Aeromicrobium sp. SORGH_AS_0981]